MVCILKIEDGEIKEWIIATDMRDAFQRASGAAIGQGADSPAVQLIDWLVSRQETVPRVGKHELPSGHVMLVQ